MMRRILSGLAIVGLFGCAPDSNYATEDQHFYFNNFSQFLQKAQGYDSAYLAEVLANYLDTLSHTPIIENETDVYFIYYGTVNSIIVLGDSNGGDGFNTWLSRLRNTDLWYGKKTFESNARIEYRFFLGPNRSKSILDPRNPNRSGDYSVLEMPKYVEP